MATITVEYYRIDLITPHDKADKLEIAFIGGWNCIVPKGRFKEGDMVLHIPIDAALPDELAISLGVKSYLGKGNRVKPAKLRGYPSYGIVLENEKLVSLGIKNPKPGIDYAPKLGIIKWEPGQSIPVVPTIWTKLNKIRRIIKKFFYKLFGKESIREPQKKSEQVQHPLFPVYTRIEHLRKNQTTLNGMIVHVTEKIHGTNSRVGLIKEGDTWKEMWGSHYRYSPSQIIYKMPLDISWVRELIETLKIKHPTAENIVLYGEIYGKGIQKLDYGELEKAYRLFDIMVDMKYLTPEEIDTLGIAKDRLVPVLYNGVYDYDKVVALANGRTATNTANHIREGIVVKSWTGQTDQHGNRLVFKYASDDYLTGNYEPDEISLDEELS